MNKKMIKDSVINTIAVSLPVLLLQLLVLPYLGRCMSTEEYGFTVTIIGMLNFISTRSGNTLNNVRLINCEKDSPELIRNDFYILTIFCGSITSVIVVVISFFYSDSGYNFVLLFFTAITMFLREYLIVLFRIKLKYKKILISYILQTMGLFGGLVIFFMKSEWMWIYFVGNLFPVIYVCIVEKVNFRFSINCSRYFAKYLREELNLLCASVLNGFSLYADKLLILPLLGASAVSIFYVASVLGRLMDMVISPVTSVILSYLIREIHFAKRVFAKQFFILLVIAFLFYFVSILFAPVFLKVLYPKYTNEVKRFLYVMIGAGILNCLYTIINIFIIRFIGTEMQMKISVIGIFCFLLTSIILSVRMNLMGFCLGTFISVLVKIVYGMKILLSNCSKEE